MKLVAVLAASLLASACRAPADGDRGARPLTGLPPPPATVASSAPPATSSSSSPVEVAPADPPPLPPLDAESEFAALEVPGFRPAVVGLPLGAREARPLVVALHGNFDRPEWQCEVWRAATGGYAFVLCPRGIPRGDVPKSADRWEYASARQTERELDAGIAALRERYREHLTDGPIVYVGFSLGAILGTSIVRKAPARYSRLVLIEGGLGGMESIAKLYKEEGGERVLLACGQGACVQKSRSLVKKLERLGLGARLVDGGNIGHTYDGAIAEGVAREWPWLVEGLPTWSAVQVKVQ